jgi:hypothetical protein
MVEKLSAASVKMLHRLERREVISGILVLNMALCLSCTTTAEKRRISRTRRSEARMMSEQEAG